ncbi:MAG: peptidase [Chloroflexales bacterium]|nr:peptidase [Chloroflexales bacterium]
MRSSRHLTALLLVALTLMPLGLRSQAPVARAAEARPPALSQIPQLPGYTEQEAPGEAANDAIEGAEAIGDLEPLSWSQVVTGTIGTSTDVDYFQVQVSGPASKVKITLDGLPADYDLVLGGGIDPSQSIDQFDTGLDGITQVGSSISAIGSSISAIGSSISAIGSSISAIGSSISAIGSSISAISANGGTKSESIDTLLWLPGTYYVVVATSNGQFSTDPYRLTIELADSGLVEPPPAPEVSINIPTFRLTAPISDITTLYIYNSFRMNQTYPPEGASVSSITNSLNRISQPGPVAAGDPVEPGVVIDLSALLPVSGTQAISDVYRLWDSNRGNPLYANYVAGLIDHVIEAATTDGVSGPGTTRAEADFYIGTEIQPIAFPNLRNIVLVGGDDSLPFYRVPDLTTIANEADYATYLKSVEANGIIDPNSAQGAALRNRMLLTDNVYGAGRPYRFYGFPFYLPRLAVGRIVESPSQIAQYLDFYANLMALSSKLVIDATHSRAQPPPRQVFAGGYDFLKDETAQIGDILRSTGLVTAEFNYLNNDLWQRPDVEQAWFDGRLDADLPPPATGFISGTAPIALSSVNAHFDHWQLLPAVHSAGNFLARRLLDPVYATPITQPLYFGSTLGYSVGCHSGYNLFDGAVLSTGDLNLLYRYQADFPQALNSHGGNWVGNTGYGYGTADGIDYSERLAVLYTQELAREVRDSTTTYRIGATTGEALMQAKQRYVRNAASLSAYDYKVVNVMNLYGLPFLRMDFSNPLPPPAEDPRPDQPNSAPLETRVPRAPDSLTGRLTRTLTFTIDLDPSDYRDIARTGSQVLDLDENDFTVTDEFNQLGGFPIQRVRVFSNSQVGMPTLPTFAYDIGARNNDGSQRLRVVDAVFLRGSYGARPAFDPQITQVATETLELTPIVSRTLEPDFRAGAGVWYPDKFFGFSTVGEGDGQRDQLTSFAAQLRADADGKTGLLRPYTQMVFQVTYDDPTVSNATADALDADIDAPVIQSVSVRAAPASTGSLAAANETLVVVEASDTGGPDGALDVSAIYVAGGDTWAPVSFREGPAGVYTAILPVKPTSARFIVRATDSAGNSSYYTGKGRLTSQSTVALPMVVR